MALIQSTMTPTAEMMAQCLEGLTQPDTNTIRSAEQQLKPWLKVSDSMKLLWQIISDANQPVAVRHVATIVLRKRLPTHYESWEPAVQNEWLTQVLRQTAIESLRPIQTGLIAVAAALQQVEQNACEPVLQFLSAAVSNPSPAAQELAFLLLQEMTETVGMYWKEHLGPLHALFTAVLQTPSTPPAVQKAAVQALGKLMSFWVEDPEIDSFAPLLPGLIQVSAAQMVDANQNVDEDFLTAVLDVLLELVCSAAPSLQQHMNLIVSFALSVLQNRSLELRVRDAGALVIATTAEAKPKSFGRAVELVGNVLDTLYQLMQDSSGSAAGALFESNPAWKADLIAEQQARGGQPTDLEFDDDDDPDAPTEASMAQGTLDMIACEVPHKYVWNPCLQRSLARMQDTTNPMARKAGVAGLGVIAEGCAEPVRENLAQILPHVFTAAQDPSPQVRESACFCLGQISEHCQPDILQYNTQILPIVFALLDDQSVAVQATSCYVLEMFCERLQPEAVRPLLDALVRKLAAMLEVTTARSVQEMAVAALAATAVAAEEEFIPYVQGVASLMARLMQVTDPTLFSLRGRALECMGHIAIAVGKEHFRPYFAPTMQSAMQGLTYQDSTDLQEFAYAVFANLAKVMKEEFAPALPDLVPHLLQVIAMEEGSVEPANGDDEDGAQFTGLDDSDDEENEGNLVLRVRTALVEVKKGAITALGEMASHTGTSFCVYLEDSMTVLEKAASNWHITVKCEVAIALPSFILPSIQAYHGGEIKWTRGEFSETNPLSSHTQALAGAILNLLIALSKDEYKQVAAKSCESLQTVIETCGPYAMVPVAPDLMNSAHELLTKTAPCFEADAMYGETPDEDDDHEGVSQAVCDLIGGFGRVMGVHFAPYLPQFLESIVEYAKSSRTATDRGMAVGCLGELAQELEGSIADYWPTVFLPHFLAGLADEDDNVKRNAAFGVGVCCQHLKERAVGDYPPLLHALGALFGLDPDTSDATAACIDNAAAAVARMITAAPTQVPLAQVLPVMLHVLPLKADMTENDTVYSCLLGLMQMNHPDIVAHRAELQRVFIEATSEDSEVDDDLKDRLRAAFR